MKKKKNNAMEMHQKMPDGNETRTGAIASAAQEVPLV